MEIQLFKSVMDMSNEDYHAIREGDERAYSSSQLKDMLDDPELFYRKYITKEIEKEEVAAFDVGTYIHAAILEPETLEQQCAIWTGSVRRGKDWDAFKEANAGKAIITMSELEKAQNAINGIKNSPIAMSVYSGGAAEVSVFIEVTVVGEDIYCIDGGRALVLRENGWAAIDPATIDFSKGAIKFKIKCRADYLADGDYIADIKSTTGNPKAEHSIQSKVREYKYDMSAALYLDVFNAAALFEGKGLIQDFLWTFATKDYPMSKTWAASEKQLMVGRAKWKKAAIELSRCLATNWSFDDSVGVIEPAAFEEDWLKKGGKVVAAEKYARLKPKTQLTEEFDL